MLTAAFRSLAVSVGDRAAGVAFMLLGALIVYLVLFDQGAALAAVLGTQNYLHELFHDGRHLGGVPCH